MPIEKLKRYLNEQETRYVTIKHSTAYTAQEVAASAHIPGKEMAKTVMMLIDGEMAMVVLPACYKVDFELLKEALGAKDVDLADEEEFRGRFPDCELGAMPPFGHLYGMEVYVAESLSDDEEIAFNAGSHRELIRLGYSDFEALAHPNVVKFSVKSP